MNTQSPSESGGGFLPPTLPISPASTAITPALDITLPPPRSHPLRPGSAKETAFIQYVDKGILEVTRKYAKKFSEGFGGEDERGYTTGAPFTAIPAGPTPQGYESVEDICTDLEKLVDVIWVSGTRESILNSDK
jgi:Subunit 11 of the general transcription factor TFIIH